MQLSPTYRTDAARSLEVANSNWFRETCDIVGLLANMPHGGVQIEEQVKLKRELGFRDLTLLLLVALVGPSVVPTVAVAGPIVLLIWILAAVLFLLPQAIAVIELSQRYPGEGGLYVWARDILGEFHGFLVGWWYMTVNIVFVPTTLYYVVGYVSFIGGDATRPIADQPLFAAAITFIFLWLITGVNIFSVKIAKWLQNIAALGLFVMLGIVAALAVSALSNNEPATTFTSQTIFDNFWSAATLSTLAVVCYSFVGLELASVVSDEIRSPARNIPRAIVATIILAPVLYGVTAWALLATVPQNDIRVVDGLLQAFAAIAENAGYLWLLSPLAVLVSLTVVGNVSAWIGVGARVPYVLGIDRFLPAALGRLHPKFRTPHIALLVSAAIASIFIIINSIGTTVQEAYLILLNTTVVIVLLPFLNVFLALLKVCIYPGRYAGDKAFFAARSIPMVAGVVGLLMTGTGIILAFVPPGDIDNVWAFELKMLLGCGLFTIPALLIYKYHSPRKAA